MNNVSFNREQFNEPIAQIAFYGIGERLLPFKKVAYPTSKEVEYSNGKKVPYPTAKGLIKHKSKRRKLI